MKTRSRIERTFEFDLEMDKGGKTHEDAKDVIVKVSGYVEPGCPSTWSPWDGGTPAEDAYFYVERVWIDGKEISQQEVDSFADKYSTEIDTAWAEYEQQ